MFPLLGIVRSLTLLNVLIIYSMNELKEKQRERERVNSEHTRLADKNHAPNTKHYNYMRCGTSVVSMYLEVLMWLNILVRVRIRLSSETAKREQ